MAKDLPRLTSGQIHAANAVYAEAKGWQLSNAALEWLKEKLPWWDEKSVLVKAAAVGGLYHIRCPWLFDAAATIGRVSGGHRQEFETPANYERSDSVDIADEIAVLSETLPPQVSFASKFTNLFLCEEVPMYDTWAEKTVKYHLGKVLEDGTTKCSGKYRAWVKDVDALRERNHVSITCTSRELDHYLWLSGMYRAYREYLKRGRHQTEARKKLKLSLEITDLFQSRKRSVRDALKRMVPDG